VGWPRESRISRAVIVLMRVDMGWIIPRHGWRDKLRYPTGRSGVATPD
jgi:hypothetical protein